MLEINSLEQRVMQMLLAGEYPFLETLRHQLERSEVAAREFTGVGFFTTFKVPDHISKVATSKRIIIQDVCAEVAGLTHGCGFILFIDDGLLGTLECHLWGDETLPQNLKLTRLFYIQRTTSSNFRVAKKRDTVSLKKSFTG